MKNNKPTNFNHDKRTIREQRQFETMQILISFLLVLMAYLAIHFAIKAEVSIPIFIIVLSFGIIVTVLALYVAFRNLMR
jgi:ABC-type antimicrobial peptide transport system permease subunit